MSDTPPGNATRDKECRNDPKIPNHPLQDWIDVQADRLAPVKRQGNEYHSACPLCGDGEDRHWVAEGKTGQVVAQCRQCEAPFADFLKWYFPAPVEVIRPKTPPAEVRRLVRRMPGHVEIPEGTTSADLHDPVPYLDAERKLAGTFHRIDFYGADGGRAYHPRLGRLDKG